MSRLASTACVAVLFESQFATNTTRRACVPFHAARVQRGPATVHGAEPHSGDPRRLSALTTMPDFATAGSPLFEEWLTLSGGVKAAKPGALGSGDALIIIDMQADFVPASPVDNPHGGRFGVAEGQNIVGPIVKLINAAVVQGAAVAATRDYHPADHVSFISEGGPFPAHCVQGTKGSYLLPPISGALASGLRQRGGAPDGVFVAFKGDAP